MFTNFILLILILIRNSILIVLCIVAIYKLSALNPEIKDYFSYKLFMEKPIEVININKDE